MAQQRDHIRGPGRCGAGRRFARRRSVLHLLENPDGFGARETITKYDKENYSLEFDFQPQNAPFGLPIKRNSVAVTLKELGPSETELRWVATPELKPHGYVMYPMLKLGFTKAFGDVLKELKAHAEGAGAEAASGAA